MFKKGEIESFVRSQDEPEKNTGPVKIITAKTFDREVLKPNRTALIMFYQPQCPHCVQLKPIFEQVCFEDSYYQWLDWIELPRYEYSHWIF